MAISLMFWVNLIVKFERASVSKKVMKPSARSHKDKQVSGLLLLAIFYVHYPEDPCDCRTTTSGSGGCTNARHGWKHRLQFACDSRC